MNRAGAGIPDSSLIICTRNRAALLVDTVRSILEGEAVPTELVIVDQSDAPNPEIASHPGDARCRVRYHLVPSRGLSRAMNEGIRLARHDVLAFTHDDVRVHADWYRSLIGALVSAGPDTVVTGQVLPSEPEAPGGFQLTLKVSPVPETFEGRIARDVLFPLNMAMHRSVVDRVGPFEEGLGPGTPFPAAEDNDYCYRVLERGLRLQYVPEAKLDHRAWRPAGDALSLEWSYGLGQGAFYAKHASLRDRFIIGRFADDVREAIRCFSHWTIRERRPATKHAAYAAAMLVGFTRWMLFVRPRRRGAAT